MAVNEEKKTKTISHLTMQEVQLLSDLKKLCEVKMLYFPY